MLKISLALCSVVGALIPGAWAQTTPSVEVIPAELAINFGTAAGKVVLYSGSMLFLDNDQPAASFAVAPGQVKDTNANGQELTLNLNSNVKDRSGERSRVGLRFADAAALSKVQEYLRSGPTSKAPETAAELSFAAASKGRLLGGGSKGRLIVTATQLVYEAVNDASDSRRWEYKEIKEFKRPNPYKVEIDGFTGSKLTLDLLGTPMENAQFSVIVDRITASRVKQ
jgi:hypothetical protein